MILRQSHPFIFWLVQLSTCMSILLWTWIQIIFYALSLSNSSLRAFGNFGAWNICIFSSSASNGLTKLIHWKLWPSCWLRMLIYRHYVGASFLIASLIWLLARMVSPALRRSWWMMRWGRERWQRYLIANWLANRSGRVDLSSNRFGVRSLKSCIFMAWNLNCHSLNVTLLIDTLDHKAFWDVELSYLPPAAGCSLWIEIDCKISVFWANFRILLAQVWALKALWHYCGLKLLLLLRFMWTKIFVWTL